MIRGQNFITRNDFKKATDKEYENFLYIFLPVLKTSLHKGINNVQMYFELFE